MAPVPGHVVLVRGDELIKRTDAVLTKRKGNSVDKGVISTVSQCPVIGVPSRLSHPPAPGRPPVSTFLDEAGVSPEVTEPRAPSPGLLMTALYTKSPLHKIPAWLLLPTLT